MRESTQSPPQRRRLHVSDNGRYLQYGDGTPFFYLADTAWELFHRLNREEADIYLANRAAKGFTVIQAVALAEAGGLDAPNAYGDLALPEMDPARPNEAYFEHIDYIVDRAGELGLFVGLLPTWGSHWKRVGQAPPYLFDAENARTYGRFLGERYRQAPIIWILGGDRAVESLEEQEIMAAMAAGLREGDGGVHLITFHPRGPGRSSDYFHDADWLNFNMIQSSHGAHDHDNGLFVAHDYALNPPKPTVDGEPRYEHIPVGFYLTDVNRYDRFTDYDARQAAYWAILAGACGHTYGNNNVWQMWTPEREPLIRASVPWQEALDHPGAFQMGHLGRLFTWFPFHRLEPAPQVIMDGPQRGGAKVRAARAEDGSYLVAYSPRGKPFTLHKGALNPGRLRELWFDPRYGTLKELHRTDNAGYQTYAPPTQGRGNDWVLVLCHEQAEVALPTP